MKNIPEQITAFRVYANNNDLLGVSDIELPDLKSMTETIKGTGVLGEYESVSVGNLSAMSVKLKFTSQNKEAFALLNPFLPLQLECKASEQSANAQTGAKLNEPIEITIFGQVKDANSGKLENAATMGNEMEIEVIRFGYNIDGKDVLLHDKVNMIHKINGIDIMAPIRAHLGLAY